MTSLPAEIPQLPPNMLSAIVAVERLEATMGQVQMVERDLLPALEANGLALILPEPTELLACCAAIRARRAIEAASANGDDQ